MEKLGTLWQRSRLRRRGLDFGTDCCTVRCRQAWHRFLRALGYAEAVDPSRPLRLAYATSALDAVPEVYCNSAAAWWGPVQVPRSSRKRQHE